ncbi:MAG: ribonuclease HII, partial [Candidatus Buchananbacteria bacterium]
MPTFDKMRYPNLKIEKEIWQQGYSFIAGLDEVGKGAWAGPIVVGAVILNPQKRIAGLRDSKLLTAKARQRLALEIQSKALAWAVGVITNNIIDQVGISQANLLAMAQALEALSIKPDYLLIDAVKLNYKNLPRQSIIDGDYKVASIAAASIMAKVFRDDLMTKFASQYPDYGFDRHKGYGTKLHQKNLEQNG